VYSLVLLSDEREYTRDTLMLRSLCGNASITEWVTRKHRSLLQKSPRRETIFCKRDLERLYRQFAVYFPTISSSDALTL